MPKLCCCTPCDLPPLYVYLIPFCFVCHLSFPNGKTLSCGDFVGNTLLRFAFYLLWLVIEVFSKFLFGRLVRNTCMLFSFILDFCYVMFFLAPISL